MTPKDSNEENQGSVKGNSSDEQAVDKSPGEERGKSEKVTTTDLKGKSVDADPDTEAGQPVEQ